MNSHLKTIILPCQKITRKIRQYFEKNRNKNTVQVNLFGAVKIVFRGKLIPANVYIKK